MREHPCRSQNGGNGPAFNYITETPDKDAVDAGAGVNTLFGAHLTSLCYYANFGRGAYCLTQCELEVLSR